VLRHLGAYLNDEIMLNYDPLGSSTQLPCGARTKRQRHLRWAARWQTTSSAQASRERGGTVQTPDLSRPSRVTFCTGPSLTPHSEPDELDNLDESFYGMCQTKIGDTHIGFVTLFRECQNDMCVRLAYSRDGKNWEWANQRQPWLEKLQDERQGRDSVMIYNRLPSNPGLADEHWSSHLRRRSQEQTYDWFITAWLEGMEHPCGARYVQRWREITSRESLTNALRDVQGCQL